MKISTISLFTALVIWAVFVAHLCVSVLGDSWCHHNEDCFGPYLTWSRNGDFFKDHNTRFRNTFTFQPKQFGENFGGMLVGLAVFMRMDFLLGHARTLLPLALVLCAVFACFPFAGGLGIISGFLLCTLAAMVIASPKLVDFAVKQPENCKFPKLAYTFNLRLWTLLSFGLVALNNVIHVIHNNMREWCDDDSKDCVGPWLIWPSDHFLDDVNLTGWGSVFSLDLNRILQCWQPVLLLIVYYMQREWVNQTVGGTLFCLLLAVFGSFGYGGNLGIVLGLNLSLLALVDLVMGGELDREDGTRESLL